MLNLQEFRTRYPQYNDMSDYELSTALHRSRYADMPYEQFAAIFGDSQSQPREEPGFLSRLGNSAMAIGEGLVMLPGGVVDTVRDIYRGGDIDVNDADAMREQRERERQHAAYLRKYQGKALGGLPEAMLSLPYSVTTMGASLGAGAPLMAAGPVTAGAAGMAASGAVAYRASK